MTASRSPVVVITGGSRGIGAEVAVRAVRWGWSVCFSYVMAEDRASTVLEQISAKGGYGRAIRTDLRSEDEIVKLFEAAACLGIVRGFVANAAVVAPPLLIRDISAARVRQVLEVNVLGTILCCREAVRRMAVSESDGRGGAIVLVSSAASRTGSAGEYVDYAASKGAVDSLGIGLSREVASEGIRVNVVRPGTTRTEIHERNGQPSRVLDTEHTIPLGRAANPGEVAEAVLWLLSDSASYCTGSFLDVAGGR